MRAVVETVERAIVGSPAHPFRLHRAVEVEPEPSGKPVLFERRAAGRSLVLRTIAHAVGVPGQETTPAGRQIELSGRAPE